MIGHIYYNDIFIFINRTNGTFLVIKINAQHNALSKAIKARLKIEYIYYVTFLLNLKHLQTTG